ncbi:MAG: hypothetical protein H7243_08845, partial [Sphingomonadaceae bacterium]|nr:hypothetical protein [Sphingomonadaceae bacterium]
MRALILFALAAAALAAPAMAAAAAATPRDDDGDRYRQCLDLAQSNPAQAVERASEWRANGGGIPAR